MKQYRVELTFTEPLLGTAPLDKEIYTNYIAAKKSDIAQAELLDEVETINEIKGASGFHRNDEGPFVYDYMVRGFFKDACGMLRRAEDTRSKRVSAYKRVIDGLVFVEERQINLKLPSPLTMMERPLRANTPQGERVALAQSECAPAGTTVKFVVTVLDEKAVSVALLTEWLDYGRYRGLGQWRNGGFGRFTYTIS